MLMSRWSFLSDLMIHVALDTWAPNSKYYNFHCPSSRPSPRYFLAKAAVPETLPESTAITLRDQPLPDRNLQSFGTKGKSQIQSLLEDVQKAADEGYPRVVADRLQVISQMFQVLDAKQGRRRFTHQTSKPGDHHAAHSSEATGGFGYRPDFMLCSVLLADKLTLAEMSRGCFCGYLIIHILLLLCILCICITRVSHDDI